MKMMRSPRAREMPALRPFASPEFGCSTMAKGQAARCLARAEDRGSIVRRSVVDQNDFVRVRGHGLLEARVQHALEQSGAIVRAELDRCR